MNSIQKIFIGGASITASPWFTWVDFFKHESKLPIEVFASKGCGNEYIVAKILTVRHSLGPDSLILVMLTNFDKWDWYVQNDQLKSLMNEKHQPKKIGFNSGFWCTGSWFPGLKSLFRDYFYNEDYFCVKAIQQILILEKLCEITGSHLEIFFDSPIWSHTEQTINFIGQNNVDNDYDLQDFLSGEYAKLYAPLLQKKYGDLATDSLIGYCWHHQLPWFNQKYGGHPPSSSHLAWYKQIARPRLSRYLNLDICDKLMQYKVYKFDQIWNDC